MRDASAVLLLALVLAGCRSSTTAGTGRSEHERDSVLGHSQMPGAKAVKKALDVQDSARARAAAFDSVGTTP